MNLGISCKEMSAWKYAVKMVLKCFAIVCIGAKYLENKTFMSFDVCLFVCLFLAQQPPVGQGLLFREVSRSHTTTHHGR